MYKTIFFILSISLLIGCVERFDLPLRAESGILVIDGSITNAPPPYNVKLSYSGVFEYAIRLNPDQVEAKAIVTLSDNTGRSTAFRYIGEGNYQTTDMSFRGMVGQSYTLSINLPDGRKFKSIPEKLPQNVAISTIYGEYKKKEVIDAEYQYIAKFDPSIPPRYPLLGDVYYAAEPDGPSSGYQVFVDMKDPANERNFYRWTAATVTRRQTTGRCGPFCNCTCVVGESCFLPRQYLGINLFSDQLSNGQTIKRRPIMLCPVFASGNMYIEVSQFSLSRECYQFWKRYEEQLSRTGSILDPLPSPIEGNIYNVDRPSELALGYFSAAGLYRQRIIIPVQLLDFELFPRGVTPRRGACLEVYQGQNAYDIGEWPTSNWSTEALN